MGGMNWEGKAPGFDLVPTIMTADADFTKIFPVQLTEGRWFQPDNIQDEHNYILNETSARQLGLHQPYVGKWFAFMNDTGHIVGIVKDFHFQDYHKKIGPLVIMNSTVLGGQLYVNAVAGRIPAALKATEKSWKQFFPQEPFDYIFLDEEFARLYRSDRKTSTLIGLFACIAIFISCLGLFGLAAFMAEQRTNEIGIRKVMGASVEGIVALLAKDFVKLVLLAVVIASPIAWWAMNKWLQGFAYRISIHGWMFVLAGLTAIMIALLTISWQAIRAAITNPVEALRTE
jgi:ABC-type antimicrobial peptide transport system permease subunit